MDRPRRDDRGRHHGMAPALSIAREIALVAWSRWPLVAGVAIAAGIFHLFEIRTLLSFAWMAGGMALFAVIEGVWVVFRRRRSR